MLRDPLQEDTIVAIATPSGTGAIGIIRLSGKKALSITSQLWNHGALSVDKFVSHKIYYGKITCFSTGENVDEAILLYFQAPNSFTGEDVVELQSHGNPIILHKILDLCLASGARMAEPGEFSRRAFLNGRIDLSQAEAVADVIGATSQEGLRCAQEQLNGRLSQKITSELQFLTELRAFVEATIDFPEEDIEFLQAQQVRAQIKDLYIRLTALAQSYQEGRLYKEGAKVALLGPPNAGKSSLLNAIVGEDRALVHHLAGTTRDIVEEQIIWDGVPIRLFDTAGIRPLEASTATEVEALGIERTHRWADLAHVRIVVIDGSRSLMDHDLESLSALPRDQVVIWCNKSDLGIQCNASRVAELFPNAPMVVGSARTGEGIDRLCQQTIQLLRGGAPRETEGVIVTTLRHKEALDEALGALQNAEFALEARASSEFVAEYLRVASASLGRIVGEVTTEDLLGEIFSRFCIGK